MRKRNDMRSKIALQSEAILLYSFALTRGGPIRAG
jgi:hypothetical protein